MRAPRPSTARSAGFLAVALTLASLLVVRSGPEARGAAAGAGSEGLELAAASLAGSDVPEACAGEEHRQFDFWKGSWVVHQEGNLAGRNEIRVVADGCGLEESWSGTGGTSGTSLNYYDPEDGRWHQLWVGSGGMILHLSGGMEGDDMVMTGERSADGETLRDRITWSPMPDGEVRQLWEISRDGGESWTPVFDGRYRPE